MPLDQAKAEVVAANWPHGKLYHTARSWVSRFVMPVLANNAAKMEMGVSRAAQASEGPTEAFANRVRGRPLTALVLAVGAGYLLGSWTASRRT